MVKCKQNIWDLKDKWFVELHQQTECLYNVFFYFFPTSMCIGWANSVKGFAQATVAAWQCWYQTPNSQSSTPEP